MARFSSPLQARLRGYVAIFFAVVLSLALLSGWFLCRQYEQRTLQQAHDIAAHNIDLLQDRINEMMSLNLSLASLVKINKGNSDFFEAYAREVLPLYPTVSHLTLAPKGTISHIYPLEGNELALGLNQLDNRQDQDNPRFMVANRGLLISGPITLVQGRLAIIGRSSIFLENNKGSTYFWGFSQVVINVDDLIRTSQLIELDNRDYDYRLLKVNGEDTQLIATSTTSDDFDYRASASFKVADGNWELWLAPKAGFLPLTQWLKAISLAVLFTLLLSYILHTLLRLFYQRKDLREIIHHKNDELLDAHTELRATLEAIPDYLFEVDDALVISRFHAHEKTFLGIPATKLRGLCLLDWLCEERAQLLLEAIIRSQQEGRSTLEQVEFSRAGHRKTYEISISQLPNSEPARVLLLMRDVSDRVRSEYELRIAATAFDTHDGMMVTDKDGFILRVNRAFTLITGYNATEVIGKRPNILSSGRHDRAFYQKMWATIHSTGIWKGEIWNRRANGDVYPEWLSIAAVKNDQGDVVNYVSTLTDITTHKEYEKRINHLSFTDELTGLPNKTALFNSVAEHLSLLNEGTIWSCVYFININNFKFFNENRGQLQGDLLLQSIAKVLTCLCGTHATLTRINNDHFALLDRNIGGDQTQATQAARKTAQAIVERISEPHQLQNEEVYCTCVVGISLFNSSHHSAQTLLLHAEQAANFAKSQENTSLAFFSQEIQAVNAKRFALINDLREALRLEQFELFYQPQIDNRHKIIGAEALIRWRHPERGMVSPADFIPAAENSELIYPLGQWILLTACKQLVTWSQDPRTAQLTLSVNVSARQFKQASFVEDVLSALQQTQADPKRLILELTESMLADNQADIIMKMSRLKSHGIRFSLDDFGTGYSSLSYLKRLPINELKIDKSFVKDVLTSSNDAAIARMIIGLAKSMELTVIAEGVEYQEHRDWLYRAGCDHYQGYFFGKPVPAHELLSNMYL